MAVGHETHDARELGDAYREPATQLSLRIGRTVTRVGKLK